ncbi:MAG: type I DNA topoisomerase [Planctomycetaceae bacterium]|nr:type I DNA topoisomerase [Planctomycetaceae bacterium]
MAETTKQRKKGLVIVESPAKAKKIAEFLGGSYEVRASVGHVRDLPEKAADIPKEFKKEPWSNLGVNVDQGFAPLYVVSPDKKKTVTELKKLLKDAEELIIATDEDREGESIGWHLVELLEPKVPVKRMVFSEITKKAILDALNNTRHIDMHLVEAQETRRVLDRLYGYTLSPLLWKKIRPRLSAGRVQSVAVRILVQRELERLAFKSGTFWDLKANLKTKAGKEFSAMLTTLEGRRIATGKDFDEHTGKIKDGADVRLLGEEETLQLKARLEQGDWKVTSIEERQQMRKPPAPFMTSTLQQEANRKLGMTARETMASAQRLYQDGHITYMRTDSVSLSQEAIQAARGRIKSDFGDAYLPDAPRVYANKQKNAQEAHEAIRPAGTEMKPVSDIDVSGRDAKLYDMIWKRTVASQMSDARLRFDTVSIEAGDAEFRATGRTVEFPGYFRAYVEGADDPEAVHEEEDAALPEMAENENLNCQTLEPLGHETKPPARYTEATLIRKLEQEGVGRPSTYASIIGTIQGENRGYVRKQNNQLVPTFTAMAVTRLLEDYFPNLVDTGFTAQMEQSLDDISNGTSERLPYLQQFYSGQEGLDQQVKAKEESIDPRSACSLHLEGLTSVVRVGKYGPFLEKTEGEAEPVTASLPDEVSPADLTNEVAEKLIRLKKEGPRPLGMHPEAGEPIYVKVGPFGPYLQVGEVTDENPKPKRVSIPKNVDPLDLSLDLALKLLELPRRLGHHPEDNRVVNAGIGRFGPYVQHAGKYKSLGKEDDVLTVTLDRAVELLAQAKGRPVLTPLRELGEHPTEGGMVAIFDGKYGPYVKHEKVNATVPKDFTPETVSMEDAVKWLNERAAKMGVKKKAAKKSTTKKAAKKTTKKKATKKKATKKKTAKKDTTED